MWMATVAFGGAVSSGVVDVQILELGRKGTRYNELKAGPGSPIKADALRDAEGLAHNVLSDVADRDAAGHIRVRSGRMHIQTAGG